jgi:hypothetical protein
MRFFIFGLLLLATSCAKRTIDGPLTDGYKVFVASSVETYIQKPDGDLILGPYVEKIGIKGSRIFVVCSQESAEINGFSSTPGRNVVDVQSGRIEFNLNEKEFDDRLTSVGLLESELRVASAYLGVSN